MSKQLKHSPTPWYTNDKFHGYYGIRSGDRTIAELNSNFPPEDDAKFIVTAVNSYEELLAACECALRWIEDNYPITGKTISEKLQTAIHKTRQNQPARLTKGIKMHKPTYWQQYLLNLMDKGEWYNSSDYRLTNGVQATMIILDDLVKLGWVKKLNGKYKITDTGIKIRAMKDPPTGEADV